MLQQSPTARPANRPEQPREARLTQELVRKVADRVYRMLIQDACLERERHRPCSRTMGGRGEW